MFLLWHQTGVGVMEENPKFWGFQEVGLQWAHGVWGTVFDALAQLGRCGPLHSERNRGWLLEADNCGGSVQACSIFY